MRSSIRILCGSAIVWCALAASAAADDVTYSYDALGRLKRADYTTGKSISYSYDAVGNRQQVTYNGTNGPPVAVTDTPSTNANHAITFDPRLNDTDPDDDVLTISAIGTASHGSVVLNSGQTITYTPTAGYPTSGNSGSDTFTYTIGDGHGHSAQGTVNTTVVNRPPHAVADSVATNFNTAKSFDPRSNDSDPEGNALTITQIATPPSPGSVAITGGGTGLNYTPETNFSGTDTFSYTISDGHSNTATANVTMTVSPQNQAPLAYDDTGWFGAGTRGAPVTPIVALDPRVNDTDPDGDALTVTSVTNGANGTVTIGGGGTSVTYQYKNSVFQLETTDIFTYTISDGHGHTGTAQVTIFIEVIRVDGN